MKSIPRKANEMTKEILLIEDDDAILESLRELLESFNYRVECAENGKAALDRLRSGEPLPGLILLDLMMPVMDGLQFRVEQMSDPELRNIPVIVMSADGHMESKLESVSADGYLSKPIRLETILASVERYLLPASA
jgi:CheY-like chemotaxis protein